MIRAFSLTLFLALATLVSAADSDSAVRHDERLQTRVNAAISAAVEKFSDRSLKADALALTVVEWRDSESPRTASHRGTVGVYPASVVKLFYLAAAHQWLEDGKLEDKPELRRALRDMIVDSSNDATSYVLDALTDTTSGPELTVSEMAAWEMKRNGVNRYFASLGYTNINCNQKPWAEGPYGRERAFLGATYTNRNRLTTEATARLLTSIAKRDFISAKRSEEMLALLERDPPKESDTQARASFQKLPAGVRLYSKAGWTSSARHDAAYLEFPDGRRIVFVIFTTGHATNPDLIPTLADVLSRAL